MSERAGGSEGGFDWKKSKFIRGVIVVAGVLGIGVVVAALA